MINAFQRASRLRSVLPTIGIALLLLPASVAANNPGVSPQEILLVKMCPGADCDQDCHWTGGAAGDIKGDIRIDDIAGITYTKIEMRSAGAAAWKNVTGNFTITNDGINPSTADGEIYWEDPGGFNNVDVLCNGIIDRFVDLRVMTEYNSGGQILELTWLLQVKFRMYCDPCGTGQLGTHSSGDQCHTSEDYDRNLRAAFSVMNQTEVPQECQLTLTDEWGWSIQPPLPASINLLPGEVVLFPVDVTVPGGTPDGFTNTVTFLADFAGNLASSNASQMTFTLDQGCEAQLLSSSTVPATRWWALAGLILALFGAGWLVLRRRRRMV